MATGMLSGTLTCHDPHQILEALLKSIQAYNPATVKQDIGPHLTSFLTNHTIKALLTTPTNPTTSQGALLQCLDTQEIQCTLTSLSKPIRDIQRKITHAHAKDPKSTSASGEVNSKIPPKTPTVVPVARSPNHSLVVGLGKLSITTDNQPRPEAICVVLNRELAQAVPVPVQLVTAWWTAKGNLMVTGGANVTPQALLLAAPCISETIARNLKLPATSPPPSIRANTKWSKIIINGAPMGKMATRGPFTPDECHAALAAVNPYYATLLITQKPNWVWLPSSYNEEAISSLSIAFEDPDGTKLRTLLAARYLYFHGNRTSVKKWKQKCNNLKGKSQLCEAKQHSGDSHPEEEVIEPNPDPPATPASELAPEETPFALALRRNHELAPEETPFTMALRCNHEISPDSPLSPLSAMISKMHIPLSFPFSPGPASAAQIPPDSPFHPSAYAARTQLQNHQLSSPTPPTPHRRITRSSQLKQASNTTKKTR
ncbi:hypothetical protein BC827DRAFT_1269242 [Russula dissimulans]|jgi:hypothetical protein|nr:hypothetical protein BC827DRAFT_1269242 [Russula dissimulans]